MDKRFKVSATQSQSRITGSGKVGTGERKKGGRKSVKRPHRSTKKRHYPLNRYSMEKVDANTSTSAKKLKSVSIFNDGYTSVLQMMQLLKLTIGPNALRLSEDLDAHRISIAEMRAQEKTKEARKLRRAAQKESEDMATSFDNLLYGPGIAD
ncbi:hypothetical protein ABEB36_009530 [Hypothenemus hampei]|uniref:Uncharacterized protein n=1 Tax=Hypothenemus hampei TaxID=57062 RepID=A0ABD1EGL5_HYPHA